MCVEEEEAEGAGGGTMTTPSAMPSAAEPPLASYDTHVANWCGRHSISWSMCAADATSAMRLTTHKNTPPALRGTIYRYGITKIENC